MLMVRCCEREVIADMGEVVGVSAVDGSVEADRSCKRLCEDTAAGCMVLE